MAKLQTKKRKPYSLDRSPFFHLESKDKLAALLGTTLECLERLISSPSNECYRMFDDEKTGRFITEPHSEMWSVHKRIAKLFARIVPPGFLQSATKKRSYKTNALKHIGNDTIFKIDVQK